MAMDVCCIPTVCSSSLNFKGVLFFKTIFHAKATYLVKYPIVNFFSSMSTIKNIAQKLRDT